MQHNRSDKKGVAKKGNNYLISQQRSHIGPLPAPEDLQYYNELIPNGAERFMQMAEKEQSYRHAMNIQSLKKEFVSKIIGQITGILALLIVSYFFITAVSNGATDTAIKYFGFAIVGLVSLFITGKILKRIQ